MVNYSHTPTAKQQKERSDKETHNVRTMLTRNEDRKYICKIQLMLR